MSRCEHGLFYVGMFDLVCALLHVLHNSQFNSSIFIVHPMVTGSKHQGHKDEKTKTHIQTNETFLITFFFGLNKQAKIDPAWFKCVGLLFLLFVCMF